MIHPYSIKKSLTPAHLYTTEPNDIDLSPDESTKLFFGNMESKIEVGLNDGIRTTHSWWTSNIPYHCIDENLRWDIVLSDEQEFAQLLKLWHKEMGVTSSLSEMMTCPSYRNIIGMGERALRPILNQLEREGDDPDHWFVALESIVGHDPIPEDAIGDTVRMAEAWLQWAEDTNAR